MKVTHLLLALMALMATYIAFLMLGPVAPLIVSVALLTYAWRPLDRGRSRQANVIAFVIFLIPGYAFAASIDIGQALSGSLQEVINAAVTALIAAIVTWAAYLAKKKFNIDIEAGNRDALTAFLQRQASSLVAMGAVKLDGVKIEVQNQALADAANQALAMIPGAMAFFGLTPAKLQQMIVDLIPKQPAVAQAQAVALDVANPATPSGNPA